jgi:hypothetical protein
MLVIPFCHGIMIFQFTNILIPSSFNLTKVMESLEHAIKRDAPIIAEYLGGAVNCDAYHMTDPRSDGLGVSSCIKQSLEDAGVAPEEVIWISVVENTTSFHICSVMLKLVCYYTPNFLECQLSVILKK